MGRWWGLGLAIYALMAQPALAGALFDGDGYRAGAYRAPVDRDPAPAVRVALPAAMMLGRAALFIDVLPAAGAARDSVTGRWTLGEAHQTIAGALWLPEVGRSGVDPVLWAGLRARVAAWRRHHAGGPVVLFCRADCWMSWNAARRLAREGVGGVYWLAEGIEGWHDAGGRLVDGAPAAN